MFRKLQQYNKDREKILQKPSFKNFNKSLGQRSSSLCAHIGHAVPLNHLWVSLLEVSSAEEVDQFHFFNFGFFICCKIFFITNQDWYGSTLFALVLL